MGVHVASAVLSPAHGLHMATAFTEHGMACKQNEYAAWARRSVYCWRVQEPMPVAGKGKKLPEADALPPDSVSFPHMLLCSSLAINCQLMPVHLPSCCCSLPEIRQFCFACCPDTQALWCSFRLTVAPYSSCIAQKQLSNCKEMSYLTWARHAVIGSYPTLPAYACAYCQLSAHP